MGSFAEIVEGILEGDAEKVSAAVNASLEDGIDANTIVNKGLIPGMETVGKLFKEGEMFVPEVLVSAKAMHAGMGIVKDLLVQTGQKNLGKIVTVTVEGDLHDIGIKLVGMMLGGAGFEVVNIGIDQPTQAIVEKVKELEPDILGMSAMLTTTMSHMKMAIDAITENGLTPIFMIGGAPTSQRFADTIGAHYSSDAYDAVQVAKKLMHIL